MKTVEHENTLSELNINVTNLSMNEKLHHREAQDNFESRKLQFCLLIAKFIPFSQGDCGPAHLADC